MKSRLFLLPLLSLLFSMISALAADVTGKWTAQVPGRGGQTREAVFNFKAEGEKLTGTMSAMQGQVDIADGKIQGEELSFTVTMNFQGNSFKFLYEGKISGEEIHFTRKREGGGGGGQTQTFTAKRAQ